MIVKYAQVCYTRAELNERNIVLSFQIDGMP